MWVDDDVLFNIPLFPSQRTPTKGTIQIQRRDENVPFVGFQGNHKARQSIYNLIFLPDIFIPEESSLEELFKENKRGKTIVSFDFKFLSRDYLQKCHSRFVQLYFATTIVLQKIFWTPTIPFSLYTHPFSLHFSRFNCIIFGIAKKMLAHNGEILERISFIFINSKVEEYNQNNFSSNQQRFRDSNSKCYKYYKFEHKSTIIVHARWIFNYLLLRKFVV